ncbi:MAG TPA: PadR family transcriptional regulator [Gemmatimonadales bacterium]|jgi:DNA-binding PadR family transcriptional regulator|nr:PadR family transcriptional regulator [Gemmatimonadales bacterium]
MTPRPTDDPAALLPLRPVELLLLTMLAAGDRHGYGLRQDILDHTGGKLELEAGSLYRHIRRLEDARLVAETAPPAQEDERRIYYRLTSFGRKVLAAEMLRLRALVRLAERHRVISPARS